MFLGSTQIRPGRFNAFGTLVAVIFVGTGNYGILLIGGPVWTPQIFQGVALIAAIAIAASSRSDSLIAWRVRGAFPKRRWRTESEWSLAKASGPGSESPAEVAAEEVEVS